MTDEPNPAEIVGFWMDAGPQAWFDKSDDFDRTIAERFGLAMESAASGRLDQWCDAAESALALILLLDQFPRNVYRDSAKAFAQDAHARRIAEKAIAQGLNEGFDTVTRRFFAMPFMHSEDMKDQQRCEALCEQDGDEDGVKFARIHGDIIARFGRFPHRNEILARPSTPEELEFLKDGGFSG